MSRKTRQRTAEFIVILLGLVLLVGLFSFDSTEASSQEQYFIYLAIIKHDGTPSPTDRPTPTLAKTPTPQWMGRPTPTHAPTMAICPLCPTKTPYIICLPSPCDDGG
jgi:hypothetical protein